MQHNKNKIYQKIFLEGIGLYVDLLNLQIIYLIM